MAAELLLGVHAEELEMVSAAAEADYENETAVAAVDLVQ